MTTQRAALGLPALLCAVLSGCVASESGSASGPGGSPTPPPDNPVLVAVGGAELAYPTAVLAGRLTFRDGCLALDGNATLWPEGTEWDGAEQVVVLADGSRLTVGTVVRVGGGEVPASVASNYNEAVQDGIDACMRSLDAASMALVSGSL